MSLIRYEYPQTTRSIQSFDEFFDRLFNNFGAGVDLPSLSEGRAFRPALDLYEDDSNYYARAELPGVNRKDVKVEAEGSVLSVSAERKEKRDGEEQTFAFERSISIPEGVDQEKVEAHLEDGVLTVTMPKQEARRPRQIQIR